MPERKTENRWRTIGRPRVLQLSRLGIGALMGMGLIGCTAMRPNEQRLVAKANMTFSDSSVFSYNASRLFPQMATGFAATGAAQNSGCTSCR